MSYLNENRFTFSGTFQATVSTINNTASNFGKDSTAETAPAWNPDGGAFWKISKSTVQTAYVSGKPSADDPLVNASFVSVPDPVPGKLVDLDPQQQGASQIWGLKLQLGTQGCPDSFAASFKPVCFMDLWNRREAPPRFGGSPYLSAWYQSVLEDIEWGDEITSPLLKCLKDTDAKNLSIKFNVDLYNWYNPTLQPKPPSIPDEPFDFTFGRVVGTVGPYLDGEPDHFVSGRLLRTKLERGPTTGNPLYSAPAIVNDSCVYVDLGNSIRTESDGGAIDPNQGDIRLAILETSDEQGSVLDGIQNQKSGVGDQSGLKVAHVFPQSLDYTDYTSDAGVEVIDVEDSLLNTVQTSPLALVKVDGSGEVEQILLQESAEGWFAREDQSVFRMDPGGKDETVRMRATQFGRPAPKGTVITLTPAVFGSTIKRPSPDDLAPLNIPATVSTDEHGWAEFCIEASDPGQPRKFIPTRTGQVEADLDGQVYSIKAALKDHPIESELQEFWYFVSVQIYTDWSKIAPNYKTPNWEQDVEPVLNQYGVLYPVMRERIGISLGDFDSVTENLSPIIKYMDFPRCDPRHMPVTRDFSASKLQLIKNWAANGAPKGS